MKKGHAVLVYQGKSGAIELRSDVENDTIWASQAQMAHLFGVNSQAITKHIRNIYADKELSQKSTCSKMEQVQIEGSREIRRSVLTYNLDVMISVGYRINSNTGTKFRQWATKTLREHITKGYTLNKKRLAKNYETFLHAVEEVKKLLPAGGRVQAEDALELIKMFASTWMSLDAYDKASLPQKGATKKQVNITAEKIAEAIKQLKEDLISKKEAADIFGVERAKGSFGGIIGNVFQSFGGEDLYPTLEEKASHLMYFIIKNHPFIDGNKRSGAFTFVWFLQQTNLLDTSRLTPQALTALTLLVAESNPKDKENMIGLILLLLKK